MTVWITLRTARKQLPRTYEIRILDLDGREVEVDGLRQAFSTYAAAKSFAEQYGKTYVDQYRFRVIGKMKERNLNLRKFYCVVFGIFR